MAQWTYNDLLVTLGLSNWQFVGLSLLLLLAWSFLTMLCKMGAIGKLKVEKMNLPAFDAIFISYQGSYDSMGVIFDQSMSDITSVFKFSNPFTIFYSSQETGKAVIGLAVNKLQIGKIGLFLSKYPMYKQTHFDQSQCLKVKYPLLGSVSPIMAIGHVYPVLQKQWQSTKQGDCPPIIEIYHTNEKQPFMSVMMPLSLQKQLQVWYKPSDYSRVFPKKAE